MALFIQKVAQSALQKFKNNNRKKETETYTRRHTLTPTHTVAVTKDTWLGSET